MAELSEQNVRNLNKLYRIEKEQQYDTTPPCTEKDCGWYNKNYRLRCSVGYSPDRCGHAIRAREKQEEG